MDLNLDVRKPTIYVSVRLEKSQAPTQSDEILRRPHDESLDL